MTELTFSLCYEPNMIISNENINYVFSDSKVHVKFDTFKSKQIIAGFERKLSYLITYLFNYNFKNTVVGNYDKKALIDTFKKCDDMLCIYKCIKDNICNKEIKGFKLNFNYNSKYKDLFGSIAENCYPVIIENDIQHFCDLDEFLSSLHVSLYDYLFNDRYYLVIKNKNIKDINSKFIRKIKNKNIDNFENSDFAILW